MALRIIFILFSWAIAECVVWALLSLVPVDLRAATDIIGFPVHSNFNVDGLFLQFYAHLFALPLIAFFLYQMLVRKFRPAPWPALPPSRDFSPRVVRLFPHLKALAVGWALGLAAVAIPKLSFLVGALAITSVYYSLWRFRPRVQKYALWLAWFGFPAVSSVTFVRESVTLVRHYPWFPWWAAALLAAAGMLYARFWRESVREERETNWILWLVVPILIFFHFIQIPRLTVFEYFHDGESLVPGLLSLRDYFPWRDLLFSHGILQDPFQSAFGLKIFGETFWGAAAGNGLILVPLYWVVQYLLGLALFRSHPFFLILFFLVLPQGMPRYFSATHFRFILQPLVLLAFLRLLNRPGYPSAFVFALLLWTQAIVTPESAYAVIAFAIVLPLFEAYADRGARWMRTRQVGTVSLGLLAGWFIWLDRHHALESFFEYYITFAPGHRYTGGIPLTDLGAQFVPVVVLTTAGSCLFTWYFLSKVFRRAMVTNVEWMLFAIQVFTWLYFQKFLSRADTHIFSVYAMCLPLLLWMAWRSLVYIDNWIPRKLPPRFLPSLVMALAAVYFAPKWWKLTTSLPDRVQMSASPNVKWPRLGYFSMHEKSVKKLDEWRAFFDAHLKPDDKVFDFSNAPGLFYFLLDRRPASRFFTVSMAIRPVAQRLVISDLERERPRLVIFQGPSDMRSWDTIPNMVRHYRLSQYLLQHYHPFARIDHTLVMMRNDDETPPLAGNHPGDFLRFGTEPCDWGYAPSFQSERWGDGHATEIPHRTRKFGEKFLTELALTVPDWREHRYLEINFDSLKPDFFVLSDRSVANPLPLYLITFFSRAEGTLAYRIPVASCMQWRGFERDILQLVHQSAQSIRSVKLIR